MRYKNKNQCMEGRNHRAQQGRKRLCSHHWATAPTVLEDNLRRHCSRLHQLSPRSCPRGKGKQMTIQEDSTICGQRTDTTQARGVEVRAAAAAAKTKAMGEGRTRLGTTTCKTELESWLGSSRRDRGSTKTVRWRWRRSPELHGAKGSQQTLHIHIVHTNKRRVREQGQERYEPHEVQLTADTVLYKPGPQGPQGVVDPTVPKNWPAEQLVHAESPTEGPYLPA
jgi:hypothetical protein